MTRFYQQLGVIAHLFAGFLPLAWHLANLSAGSPEPHPVMFLAIAFFALARPSSAEHLETDLLIVGATESGWAAAIQAARMRVAGRVLRRVAGEALDADGIAEASMGIAVADHGIRCHVGTPSHHDAR